MQMHNPSHIYLNSGVIDAVMPEDLCNLLTWDPQLIHNAIERRYPCLWYAIIFKGLEARAEFHSYATTSRPSTRRDDERKTICSLGYSARFSNKRAENGFVPADECRHSQAVAGRSLVATVI